MRKRAAAMKRSAARKSKSIPKVKAVSSSTDDVYNLLKAVNEITLKRMEDKIDRIRREQDNWVELFSSYARNQLNPMRNDVTAIKDRPTGYAPSPRKRR